MIFIAAGKGSRLSNITNGNHKALVKINNKSLIKIENLDLKKRPVSDVADNTEVRNASIINIKIKKNIVFKVLYNKKFGLKEKNLAEHFKF